MKLYPCLLLIPLCVPTRSAAYSVLTHEAIIDDSWDTGIKPLLLKRFPHSTTDQLREAHGYAYGGAIIQDMGYYPSGSKFFSDLVHYVRSGDFVDALIRESQNLNQYAFALGALAHYASDNTGHPLAVNRVVPMLYPKLRAKYGPEVTYEDNPAAHIKTEFAFDVIEVARGKYASEDYHDFIGFQTSAPVLARAFADTYCLRLNDVFQDVDRSLETYRHTVSKVIPRMTEFAWSMKKNEIQKLQPGMTRDRFIYRLSPADYRRTWSADYDEPGPGTRVLAWFFKAIPKVGPAKALAFKIPTPEEEKLFVESFDGTLARYRTFLAQVRSSTLRLQNENIDIGRPTHRGEYQKADKTYARLLEELGNAPDNMPAALRANIIAFYRESDGPPSGHARAVLAILRGQ